MVHDHFCKNMFLTHFFIHLWSKKPIFKSFWDFTWPKMRHHGLDAKKSVPRLL